MRAKKAGGGRERGKRGKEYQVCDIRDFFDGVVVRNETAGGEKGGRGMEGRGKGEGKGKGNLGKG